MSRRTKIVATIGPASDSPQVLEQMILAGMDVARVGMAHGSIDEHIAKIGRIREASAATARHIAILADLPGPKVRAAAFPDGGVELQDGQKIDLAAGTGASSTEVIEVDYDTLATDLLDGDSVTLGDGNIVLRVSGVPGSRDRLEATVIHGGKVQGRPGVHLPSDRVRLRAPTQEDLSLLEALAECTVEHVAVSFVREGQDMRAVRRVTGDHGPKLVAKIETRKAVENLIDIVEASDVVMVARGDLGNECPLEDVPHLQKQIVKTGVAFGLPVIIATQMLESMVHSPVPTRAEVSDVANAIYDGTSAIMLSGESAIGQNPVNAVRTMSRIAERAEQEVDFTSWADSIGTVQNLASTSLAFRMTAALTRAAWRVADDTHADAILCCTRTGTTARSISRYRPATPIIGASFNEETVRQLAMSWGVIPLLTGQYSTTDDMIHESVTAAEEAGLIKTGDLVLVLAGAPDDPDPVTDVLRLLRIGFPPR